MSVLDRLEVDVKALIAEPFPSDEEAVDLAGRVNKLASDLAGYKRALLSEIPGPVAGHSYRLVTERKADRSYNTAAILAAFADKGWGLHDLHRQGAVSLGWRWTQLKRAFSDAGADLQIAGREIEDNGEVEGPHVGELWKESTRLEGVKF